MAGILLTDTQSRANFFHQTVLNNLHYWRTWLDAKITDVIALDEERNGIVKAISFALKVEEAWPLVFELVATLSPFMERRGHWEMWHWVLNQALETARQVKDASSEVTLSVLLARLSFQQSRFKETRIYYQQAIRLARRIGDRFNEARACTNLGYYYIEQGYWHRAELLCCHALTLFEQLDSNHGRAHTENHLGFLYTRQHRWDQAQHHLERACAIWQMMGDEHGLMRGFINLSGLYTGAAQLHQAHTYLEKALHQARLIGAERDMGTIYMNMGRVYRLLGDLTQAEAYARKAEAIFLRFSSLGELAQVWDNLGIVYFHQGWWQEAFLQLKRSLEAWRNLGNKQGAIEVLMDMIDCELVQGDQQQAMIRLKEVEQLIGSNHEKTLYRHLQPRLEKYRRSLTEKPPQ